jgi:Leucine-rich repeat (LRR) protein
MESLTRHQTDGGSYWTLGGWESDRLQFARYRGLSNDFLLPLEKLAAMNRADLQASEDIRKIYTQSAGLSHYLMDAQGGIYREPTVTVFRALYEGRDTVGALEKLLGASSAELDRDYLGYLQVTDVELARIPSPERIRNLSLGRTKVTDKGLAHLAACKNLDWLDLSLTKTTDTGLASIKDCTALTQLFLEGTKISDESLKLIGKLSSLEELDLSALAISDNGLAHLAALKKLKILHLTNNPVSNAGLDHLKSLSALESLETSGTKVTASGLASLRSALPRLKK